MRLLLLCRFCSLHLSSGGGSIKTEILPQKLPKQHSALTATASTATRLRKPFLFKSHLFEDIKMLNGFTNA